MIRLFQDNFCLMLSKQLGANLTFLFSDNVKLKLMGGSQFWF